MSELDMKLFVALRMRLTSLVGAHCEQFTLENN